MGGGDEEYAYSERHHHHHREGQHNFDGSPSDGSQRRPPDYYNQPTLQSPLVKIYKIYCEERPDYYLTVRSEGVVLAPGDDSNVHQQWIKDQKWSTRVKDESGFPAFSLINKATRLALWHGTEMNEQVSLQAYDQNTLDESVLWTLSGDVGNDYQCIRPAGNIRLNLDANHMYSRNGVIEEGTNLILFKWKKQQNQKWKIMPISASTDGSKPHPLGYNYPASSTDGSKPHPLGYNYPAFGENVPNPSDDSRHGRYEPHNTIQGQEVKIHSEAKDDFYISARSDGIVLAPGDDSDIRQAWIKDDSWGTRVKDKAGFPAFALINKATQKALQHGSAEFDQVGLTSYDPSNLDESVLWTLSADVGHGYKCLRPVGNIHLNLDANHGDLKHGGVHDGTNLILYKWLKRENQKWKLVKRN